VQVVVNKDTKISKGIAFVDFETSEAAEGAISAVRKDISSRSLIINIDEWKIFK
jgi:RNA recognition motif-containing protein